MLSTIGRHVPPPPGVLSPMLWGTRARLEELFGGAVASLEAGTETFTSRYRSPEHFVDFFRTYFGPMHAAFAALPADAVRALEADLLALVRRRARRARSGSVAMPAEYLQAVLVRA